VEDWANAKLADALVAAQAAGGGRWA